MTSLLASPTTTLADHLLGWDHVEWWVGNARAVTAWLMSGFGFHCTAYAGPETGVTDRVAYLLEQGDIRFVVTAALNPGSDVARHVLAHGDGVRHLAWRTNDPLAALAAAERGGAVPIGATDSIAIASYGETAYLLLPPDGLDRSAFTAEGLPLAGPAVGLRAIDHVVGNVEEGRLDAWVAFHERLGFHQLRHFDADQISTEYSALRSTVMVGGPGITLPLNEPAPGRRKSQIQEYLEAYRGPGVQHLAVATDDIVAAVSAMRERGVRFLTPPATYYEEARDRVGRPELPWDELARLGILVDTDAGGYLLQVFTENVTDRPTLFVEVIERRGATGFGEGNFKALFEAIEREQARRGNL